MQPSRTPQTRLIIRPMFSPPDGIDVTERVLDAIADEIGRLHNGNQVLNRLEAEILLADMLQHQEGGRSREDAS